MQIELQTSEFVSTGEKDSRHFTVALGPHIMMVLSGLYSNIPWAIVREYGTNMWDGYVRLRKDRGIDDKNFIPPEIHLPNRIEPWISFKDFGIGMSYETVWEVFSEYGGSTKRDNNDEVGGLGLGSKTAFCYCEGDQWTIESRYDGKKMFFSAAKDDKGIPKLIHMSTIEMDRAKGTWEPNGVTIQISVKRQDVDQFRDAVQKLYRYFPMDIKVSGNQTFSASRPTFVANGSNWSVADSKTHNEGVVVMMGNVPYPVGSDIDSIKSAKGRSLESRTPVILRVPIGSVDITPSRESLKWTDRTRSALKAAIDTFWDELPIELEKLLQNANTVWEAICRVYDLSFGGAIPRTIPWKGKQISPITGVDLPVPELRSKYPDVVVQEVKNSARKMSHYWTQLLDGADAKIHLHPSQHTFVFLDDLGKRGAISRVKEALPSRFQEIRMRKGRWYDASISGIIVKAEGLTLQAITDLLGGFPVETISSLPVPERDSANPGAPRRKIAVKQWTKINSYSDGWKDCEADGGYYIRMSGRSGQDIEDHHLKALIDELRFLKIIDKDTHIYGIPRTFKNLEKKPEWVDFLDEMKNKVQPIIDAKKQDLSHQSRWQGILENRLISSMADGLDEKRLSEDSPFRKFMEEVKSWKEKMNELLVIRNVADRLKCILPEHEFTDALQRGQPMTQLCERYQLIGFLSRLTNQTSWWGDINKVDGFDKTIFDHVTATDSAFPV